MTDSLIMFEWDGEAMVPMPRYAKRADREYVIGYRYLLETYTPEEQRSRKHHGHYFATVTEYWRNLPETLHMEAWAASAEFLRHRALIETGWFNAQEYHCSTNAEALRWMAQLPHPVNEKGERVFYQRSAAGTVLVQRTPKSQAYRAMKKAEFQKSSQDVLDFLESLIGARADGVAA